MSANDLRRRFLDFFSEKGHQVVSSSSLLPDDPSVLLTTAGMQQFKPYFLGEPSPWGLNVVSIQKCFRTSDIDEVGDKSHLTFFEMLGNFSFGGYGKAEAIKNAHEFLTQALKDLGPKIDYVTIFGGDQEVPEDTEAAGAWRALGITDIRRAGREDNFWGPTGKEGPCGPTTEIYIRGVEIWNIVFNEYYYRAGGRLERLETLGIDTGMGFERLVMIAQNKPTIFETDLFAPLLASLPLDMSMRQKRIVADHVRAAAFLIADGVRPENKGAGYILRRLLRRLLAQNDITQLKSVLDCVIEHYKPIYPELGVGSLHKVFDAEWRQFGQALGLGLNQLGKLQSAPDARQAFYFYQTYGLPFELMRDRFPDLRREDFEKQLAEHQEVSRAGLGHFAGGLADHDPRTIKLHTAHHLLLAALQKILGPTVKQRGSNITQERLRLDFTYPEKLTGEEKQQVEALVNQKIQEDLVVFRREMSRSEAEKLGAEREFGQKYGDEVSVYVIEGENGSAFSKEFCAGPHVSRTSELGHFKIIKEEAVGTGIRRIKAILE